MSDYILDGKTPARCDEISNWGKWYEKASRKVCKTEVGEVSISTVFLSIDHSFIDGADPILFETMIFGGVHDQDQWRYSTWDEAEEGHNVAVALVKESIRLEANNEH